MHNWLLQEYHFDMEHNSYGYNEFFFFLISYINVLIFLNQLYCSSNSYRLNFWISSDGTSM